MVKRFAAIYIGSNKCEMVVGQRGKGGLNILDRAMYPIDFGTQSLTNGSIRFDSVYALCGILNEYIQIAQGSDVNAIEILGTASLREAVNCDYVMEQIRVFTGGHELKLLTREEEVELLMRYMVLVHGMEKDEGDSMMVTLSSGYMSMAIVSNQHIVSLQSEELGYLKMKDLFQVMEERTGNFENLLSDFVTIRIREFSENIRQGHFKRLIVTSHEVGVLAEMCGAKVNRSGYYVVTRKEMTALRKEMEGLSGGQLQRKYPELSSYQAETVRYTLMLLIRLTKDANLEEVALIRMSIGDARLAFSFNVTQDRALNKWIDQSAEASCWRIAERYRVDLVHNKAVAVIAEKLFSGLRKQYQMDADDLRLLRMAASMVDIGRYVGNRTDTSINRRIIENTQIIGVSDQEKRIIGRIVDGIRLTTFETVEDDEDLPLAARLTAAKLIAVLKLATALDKSHKQKVGKIRCHLDAKVFEVTVQTSKNIQLEEYFFMNSGQGLKDVFGVEPVLKVKRVTI